MGRGRMTGESARLAFLRWLAEERWASPLTVREYGRDLAGKRYLGRVDCNRNNHVQRPVHRAGSYPNPGNHHDLCGQLGTILIERLSDRGHLESGPCARLSGCNPDGHFSHHARGCPRQWLPSDSTIQVAGSSVPTTFVSPTELQASVASTRGSLSVDVLNPDPGSSASPLYIVRVNAVAVLVPAAARLLDQATFGPTLSDIQHVQSIGFDAYLTEQFATAPTVLADLPSPLPTQCAPSNPKPCEQSEWWTAAMTGPDQLRQRVALALAEMFVVSTNSNSPYAIIPYHNLLTQDAFANFSTLMKDVTLSTAMAPI